MCLFVCVLVVPSLFVCVLAIVDLFVEIVSDSVLLTTLSPAMTLFLLFILRWGLRSGT